MCFSRRIRAPLLYAPLSLAFGDTVMAFSEIELARVRKALDAFMAKPPNKQLQRWTTWKTPDQSNLRGR